MSMILRYYHNTVRTWMEELICIVKSVEKNMEMRKL